MLSIRIFVTSFLTYLKCSEGNSAPISSASAFFATDRAMILGRVENCSPKSSEVDLEFHYKQGIVSGGVQSHDSSEPDLADLIRKSLEKSHYLTWRNDWLTMKVDKYNLTDNVEKTASLIGVVVPSEKILTVYQLLLMVGEKTFYSSKIWSDFEDCPKYKIIEGMKDHEHFSSLHSDEVIVICVISSVVIIIMAIIAYKCHYAGMFACCGCGKSQDEPVSRSSFIFIVPLEDSTIQKRDCIPAVTKIV